VVFVTKAELVAAIADRAGITKKDAGFALDAAITAVTQALRGGDRIRLDGIGTFGVVQRKERVGRNPQTGETITVPARRVVKFKPAKTLKGLIA
jgi:DNA-binding protein HU-beta